MKEKLKFVSILIIAFILSVPIGTILHEMGHFAVAKLFYLDVTLFRASVDAQNYKFADNEAFGSFLTSLAGPVSTVLTCFIGISLINRSSFKKISVTSYRYLDIVKLILAFFVTRELIISLMVLFVPESINADEYKIATYLNLNTTLFCSILLLISTSLCFYTLNKTVKKSSKGLFLLGASVGCGIGFYLWILL